MQMYKRKRQGFTIVELLVVIVVIAILATITIVAYNGIQQRARDTRRKTDLATMSKALQLYSMDNNNYIETGSNCGSGGNGSGWFNPDYDTTGPLKSIAQCLTESGVVSSAPADPTGTVWCNSGTVCRAYMKYTCASGTFLYASLESEPAGQDVAAINSTCAPSNDTLYGMNYVVKVN